MADDVQTSYPYIDASGKTVDLAYEDEITIARICHYVMLHCTKLTFLGNPNNKKQYGLKAGLKILNVVTRPMYSNVFHPKIQKHFPIKTVAMPLHL
jgi:hypothetical protein